MKRYSAVNVGGSAMIVHDGRAVLEGIRFEARLSRGMHAVFPLLEICADGDDLRLVFSRHPLTTLELTLHEEKDTLLFSVRAACAPFNNGFGSYLCGDGGLTMTFSPVEMPEGVCASTAAFERFWQCPVFVRDLDALPPVTQSLLWHSGGVHRYLLPLTGRACRSEICGKSVQLSTGCSRQLAIDETFLAYAEGGEPFSVVQNVFFDAKAAGAIRVALRGERRFPERLDGIGFCTWNAFYTEMTADKIYAKLAEFRTQGVPIRFVIIDDGWQQNEGGRLAALEEDRKKFPEGLAACIAKIKREFGVRYVGVWHAFTGYWDGILPGSAAAAALDGALVTTPGGVLIPAPDEESQFRFFDTWHGYLAAQGVDFVKVDNQSGLSNYYNEMLPTCVGVAAAHRALDRSVEKHFGGCLINCMGMDMENVLNRPTSPLDRNSRDYAPGAAGGVYDHLQNNVYSAVFHDRVIICDFDMFWSKHDDAKMSAVLRALGGGPLYVSDQPGGTDAATIRPLLADDGRAYRTDRAACPTIDCLYSDRINEGRPMKIWSGSGDAFAAAAFCRAAKPEDDELKIEQIPTMDGAYVAVEYETGRCCRFDREHPIRFSVGSGEVRLWNFYPIRADGTVMLGRADKYIGCATEKTCRDAADLIGE